VKRTLQVTKLRAGPSLEGSHDFTIRHGGLQVFRRLIASEFTEWRAAERCKRPSQNK
jgi:hypothetical protein